MISRPISVNIESLFTSSDTSSKFILLYFFLVTNNDIEQILAKEKFKYVIDHINLSKYT
jgi:hypothetical protein